MTGLTEPEHMRKRAEWMMPADDQILELLRGEGNLTPEAINNFGGPSADHSMRRCKTLARYNLVEQLGRGLYRITDKGYAYLDEELDASELEPVDE